MGEAKRRRQELSTEPGNYYWIAINGATCTAALAFPAPQPTVSPVPEMLVGFPTRQEALKAQDSCLNSPDSEVQGLLRSWKSRKDLKIVIPTNPGPPTNAETHWNWGGSNDGHTNLSTDVDDKRLTIHIGPLANDAVLAQEIINGAKYCALGFDVRLALAGYDTDPRELNEIPEAVETLRSWIRLGGLSALSLMMPNGSPFDGTTDSFGMPADGVWAFAKGWGNGSVIDPQEFLSDLERSNDYCDEHHTGENHRSVSPKCQCPDPEPVWMATQKRCKKCGLWMRIDEKPVEDTLKSKAIELRQFAKRDRRLYDLKPVNIKTMFTSRKQTQETLAGLKTTDVIIGHDPTTGSRFVVYGRTLLRDIIDTAKPLTARVAVIDILQATDELEMLLGAVQAAHGHHEYLSTEDHKAIAELEALFKLEQ